ncbi:MULTISPECIES: AAA family ATPase [Rhodococcus]|nr:MULTISPECIES: AAA family ATPase [Rhodococcus]
MANPLETQRSLLGRPLPEGDRPGSPHASRHFGRHWQRTAAQIEVLSALLLIRVGQIGHIMHFRHITISGEPGSGKSSVGRELARIYGMDIVSTGALQRELAASLGVSLLDVNKRAELDQSIDLRIDSIPQGKGAQTTSLIFDSRLAWHFVPNAFKLHLIVDPTVAAERLHRTRESSVGGAHRVRQTERRADLGLDGPRIQVPQHRVDVDRQTMLDISWCATSELHNSAAHTRESKGQKIIGHISGAEPLSGGPPLP